MHYGDKEQLDSNILTLIVYKLSISDDKFLYRFTSIQECKYFPIHHLQKILSIPEYIVSEKMKDLPAEEWYEMKIKNIVGWNEIEIISIENVSKHIDEFKRLH